MNVLIIPEDFRNDQYILKPLFSRLFQSIVKRRVHVDVCRDPLLGGVGEALKSERIKEVIGKHRGMTDIFILCIDRDGEEGRRQRLDQLEEKFDNGQPFFAENAWEKIETWLLAGLDLPANWNWRTVREEVQVKETYFEPLTVQRNLSDTLGGGRKHLGEEASRRVDAIRQKCPEDFDALAQRLEAAIQNT
ncbi:MAG: hypothetical protein F4Z85_11540 [Gemmatimonadetes bacterium]|nr:hypothetical protein [Gemmatimonadota bacterium]MYB70019.1 hypothetical protein [Gemmatimonadota bacterium]